MEKRAEIQVFTEELWANITAMMAGTEMTPGDVLQAVEAIRERLQRWQARECREDGRTLPGSTTQS